MHNLKKTIAYILLGICSFGLLITGVTFAWLATATTYLDFSPDGNVLVNYFYDGDGSENTPFRINDPVHFNNLTELYARHPTFYQENYHFKLMNNIDMSDYPSYRPIGSESKPFNGIFDGDEYIVENINVVSYGESDIGIFGYVGEDAEIRDVYFDNVSIDVTNATEETGNNHNANAYVGYIAGHIKNAWCVTNTYVNHCEITGGNCHVKNDWGFYGKCDNAATLEDFIAKTGEEEASWGGSVKMQDMYNRLTTIAQRGTDNTEYPFEKDIITTYTGSTYERPSRTGEAYTYRSRTEGSFVFAKNHNGSIVQNYMYLNGGARMHPKTQTVGTKSGYYISYNGTYLGISNNQLANVQQGWEFSNNKLSTMVDGVTYYLDNDLNLVTSTDDTWTKNNNQLYYETGGIFGFFTTKHYLYYSNGWTTRTNSVNLTWTNTTITYVTGETVSGDDYMDYSGENVTYFPLITESNSNYSAAAKNTGYVISGSEHSSDIRVSKYSTSDISASYSNSRLTTVYTINENNQKVQINPANFTKYADAETEFLSSISSGSIYGLHFMPANISINHLVTAEYTLINGQTKENYEMPASSIDFNVMQKGSINFFAGTYFSGNNSFFSLHEISRDSNDQITDIKEISEIYKSSNDRKPYIYKYSDNSTSGTITADYSLEFSTSRIKTQPSSTWTNNAVYYFEIPVNAGEFALGSVDGGTGAYLMYLDIGSNGGIDYNAEVDTFGSVDYRSDPGFVTSSILLITYDVADEQSLTISVEFENNVYRITASSENNILIKITPLNIDGYEYYLNGNLINTTEIKTYSFYV